MISAVALLAVSPLQGGIRQEPFGITKDGKAVSAYTLTNAGGTSVTILDFGGIVTRLRTRDAKGAIGDIATGFDDLAPYEEGRSPYFGAIVGRYANRIAKGRFTLDGKTYRLAINNAPNSLHGGVKAWDKRVWDAKMLPGEQPALRLGLVDRDGTEGFPGTVRATVTYTLTSRGLQMDYVASTTKATPINPTNHTYFNLKDGGATPILGHRVLLSSDAYTPVDKTLIPVGSIAKVAGTPLDFRKPKAIGKDIVKAGGYDHNFVVRGKGYRRAAFVVEPNSGRTLEVWTDQPGIQLYTGNFLDGSLKGWNGAGYGKQHAFCLETQHYPDSPNQKAFPSTILRPGETFRSRTEYRFGVVR